MSASQLHASETWLLAAVSGLVCLVVVTGLTRWLIGWLRARQVMDVPNDRSSHAVPTPRGGGLGVVPVVLAVLGAALWQTGAPAFAWTGLGAAAGLAVLSWADDRASLSAGLRLAVQAVAVAVPLALWPADFSLWPQVLPLWLDRLVVGLAWLWFINLYNFMDGIDGITGVQTASIGAGLVVVALAAPLTLLPYSIFGAAMIGAAAGFLVWNWHPAKVFLGDVGSVPLGYLLGLALVSLATEGHAAPAVLIAAYYLSDATLTLARRVLRGASPVQPHREHFYQKAVHLRGLSHAAVSLRVAVGNVVLVILAGAVAAGMVPWGLGLLAGAAVVAALLAELVRRR